MVMNARKLTRLNDGYFDRNPTHPYQNSNKYSKSSYNDRYGDKMRDSTSNGNMYGRNESPDTGNRPTPRDRSYHNKASYSQRIKERERDKLEKDSNKSPMEKLKVMGGGGGGREQQQHPSHRNADAANCAEHRNNHDRTTGSEVAVIKVADKEKEKRLQVGDWSEHMSSSGKKYYYNCKTEVSQWEKPKEWMDWEKQQGKVSNDSNNKSKDIGQDKSSDKHSSEHPSRSSLSHYHHPASRFRGDDRHHSKPQQQQQQQLSSTSGASAGGGGSSSSRGGSSQQQHGDHFHHRNSHAHFKDERQGHGTGGDHNAVDHQRLLPRDMAGRRDADRRAKSRKSSEDSQTQDMDISSDSTPSGSQGDSHSQTQTPVSYSNQHCSGNSQHTPPPNGGGGGGSSMSKLLSQFTGGNKGMQNADKQELSAHEALQTLQTALLLTRQVTMAQSNMPSRSPHSSCTQQQQPDSSPFLIQRSPVPVSSHQSQLMGLSHHNSLNEHKLRAAAQAAADEERERAARSSPGSEYSHRSSSRGSPTSSVCSVQGPQGLPTTTGTTSLSAAAALRPAVPTLSPSLANYFRDDLIKHVMGWQADHAERQANKYSEEAHNLGSLTCTKVSAELKTSRSLVRVAEIQATLQEQRILFLRQQIKELEDWKSQNSFMNNS